MSSPDPPKALIVGLNPALQKRFILSGETLQPGQVHRAAEVQEGIGGKGQDVATTLECLDFTDFGLAQLVGTGVEGDKLLDLMNLGSHDFTVRCQGPLRTCTSIVASDCTTELVEPSATVQEAEWNALLERLDKREFEAVCFMGSVPPGVPKSAYAKIMERISVRTLCLIDSVVGLEELLGVLSDRKQRAMLKINESELFKLCGLSEGSTSFGAAIQIFLNKHHAVEALAITNGSQAARFIDVQSKQIFELPIPKLKGLLYPIGAGDAVAAGTLANVLRNPSMGLLDAFAYGLQCGSATCLQAENSALNPEDLATLERVVPKKISDL